MLDRFVSDADKELLKMARRNNNPVLQERGYTGRRTLNFAEVITEVQSSCPTVYSFLSWMMQLDINSVKKFSSRSYLGHPNVYQMQRVNTVLLYEGDASHEVHCLHVIYVGSIIFTLNVTKLQVWIPGYL